MGATTIVILPDFCEIQNYPLIAEAILPYFLSRVEAFNDKHLNPMALLIYAWVTNEDSPENVLAWSDKYSDSYVFTQAEIAETVIAMAQNQDAGCFYANKNKNKSNSTNHLNLPERSNNESTW